MTRQGGRAAGLGSYQKLAWPFSHLPFAPSVTLAQRWVLTLTFQSTELRLRLRNARAPR